MCRAGRLSHVIDATCRLRHKASVMLLVSALLTACEHEITLLKPLPTAASPGDGDSAAVDSTAGTLQRATLTIRTHLAPGDAALAATLGLPDGVLPEAAVTVSRVGTAASTVQGTTDSAGATEFSGLLVGRYDVSVLRLLSAAERALLDSSDADVTGFAGGGSGSVSAPSTEFTITTSAGRRGSLVISELFPAMPRIGDQGYNFATYIELYNNTDTTIYLDGKLIGMGPFWFRDFGQTQKGFFPCSLTVQWQDDPDGLWAPMLIRLPGNGTSYPLGPGLAAVVASDAIDHSVVDRRLPNLTTAAFESVGSADVDNPSVPNARTIVLEFQTLGRGMMFFGVGGGIHFVADAVDLNTVPWMRPGSYNNRIPRIPRAKILDVFASSMTPALEATEGMQTPLCDRFINEVFDRQRAVLFDPGEIASIQRRTIGLFDGRVLLQRTKSSAADFISSRLISPGVVR